MDSDERRLNVLLIVRDKVTRQCPQATTFEEKGEPKRNRTEVLLLTKTLKYYYNYWMALKQRKSLSEQQQKLHATARSRARAHTHTHARVLFSL